MEKIDLSKDPYFMMNHVGTFECRLCLTVHTNEGSYLAHTQGKKHQVNLARRQQREKQQAEGGGTAVPVPQTMIKKSGGVKIGRPGYKVTKERDPATKQMALLFEIEYPSISKDTTPKYRIMSAYEQRVEPPDTSYQYLLVAADPYETIAFKVPNLEVDTKNELHWENWDVNRKVYTLQLFFSQREARELPALPEQVRQTSLAFHGGGGFVR